MIDSNYFRFPRMKKKEKKAVKFLQNNFNLICNAILKDESKTYCQRERLKEELHLLTDSLGFTDKKCFEEKNNEQEQLEHKRN